MKPPIMLDSPDVLRLHEKGIWVTKQGKEIPLPQLEDSHLLNIERFLSRIDPAMTEELILEGYVFLSTLRGEMAQYAVEGEIAALEQGHTSWLGAGNIYDKIFEEIERRELEPLE